jgi:hypothetical protein
MTILLRIFKFLTTKINLLFINRDHSISNKIASIVQLRLSIYDKCYQVFQKLFKNIN